MPTTMKRIVLTLLLLVITYTVYTQEKRLALVIGNSDYQYGGELANPVNDAISMEQVLHAVGFDVIKYENLDQKMMRQAIDNFGNLLKNIDIGLFFYAGHGVQAKGFNYLIPVDAALASEEEVEYSCVRADRVLGKMEAAANKTNIVILDACRNNPFERSWTRSPTGRGLAFMNAPTGSLIAYATSPGNTASDGTGANGLYTSALITYMIEPNITAIQMFQQVRTLVRKKSNGNQVPWESTSLEGDFYFNTGNSIQAEFKGSLITPDKNATIDWTAEEGTFIDERDYQVYDWVRIGEQIWMAKNLNYVTVSGSWCYDDQDTNCITYGRLYDWETAKQVCPDGWHLPIDYEWKKLEHQLGMRTKEIEKTGYRGTDEGGKLKETGLTHWRALNKGSTNASGFSALPGGYRNSIGSFSSIGDCAFFWSSMKTSDSHAWCRILNYNYSDVVRYPFNTGKGFSVRCIKYHRYTPIHVPSN